MIKSKPDACFFYRTDADGRGLKIVIAGEVFIKYSVTSMLDNNYSQVGS